MAPRRAAALRDGADRTLREHLLAAATRLIARRGTAGLTVREIAREARVADGVLYNHFADKEELLAHALHAHVRDTEADLGPLPGEAGAGTVAGNLRAYLRSGIALHIAILPAFAGLLATPAVLARFAELDNPMAAGRGMHAALADYLRAERRLGRIRHDAHPDAAATMIVGACHDLVIPRMFGGAPTADIDVPDRVVDELVATVLSGIAPPVREDD